MEKHYFTYFNFGYDPESDVVGIGVQRKKIFDFSSHAEKSNFDYYPGEQMGEF
jgi:hypothetical protein